MLTAEADSMEVSEPTASSLLTYERQPFQGLPKLAATAVPLANAGQQEGSERREQRAGGRVVDQPEQFGSGQQFPGELGGYDSEHRHHPGEPQQKHERLLHRGLQVRRQHHRHHQQHKRQQQEQQHHNRHQHHQYGDQQQQQPRQGGGTDCSLPLPDCQMQPSVSLWQDPEDQALAEDDRCSEDGSTYSTSVGDTCGSGDGGETQPGSSCDGGGSEFQMDTCGSLPTAPQPGDAAAAVAAPSAAAAAPGTDSGTTAPLSVVAGGGHVLLQAAQKASAAAEDQRQASDDGGGAGTDSSCVVGGGGARGGSKGGGSGSCGGVGGSGGGGGGVDGGSSREDAKSLCMGGAASAGNGADGAGTWGPSRDSSFAPPWARDSRLWQSGGQDSLAAVVAAAAGAAGSRWGKRACEGADAGETEAEGCVTGNSDSPHPARQLPGGGSLAGPSLVGLRRQSCSDGSRVQEQALPKRRCVRSGLGPGLVMVPPEAGCGGSSCSVAVAEMAGQQQEHGRTAVEAAVPFTGCADYSTAGPYDQRNASQVSAVSREGSTAAGAPLRGGRVRPDPCKASMAAAAPPPPPPQARSWPYGHPDSAASGGTLLLTSESPRTPAGSWHPEGQRLTPRYSSAAIRPSAGALLPAAPVHTGDFAWRPPGAVSADGLYSVPYTMSPPTGPPGCGVAGGRVSPGEPKATSSPTAGFAPAAMPSGPATAGVGPQPHFCRCPACCPGGVGVRYFSGSGIGFGSGDGIAASSSYASYAGGAACSVGARFGYDAGNGASSVCAGGAVSVLPGTPACCATRAGEPAPPGFGSLHDLQVGAVCPAAPARPTSQGVSRGVTGPGARYPGQVPLGSAPLTGMALTGSLPTAIPPPAGTPAIARALTGGGQAIKASAATALAGPPQRGALMPHHVAAGQPSPAAAVNGSVTAAQCSCALCINRTRQQQRWSSSSSSPLHGPGLTPRHASAGKTIVATSAEPSAVVYLGQRWSALPLPRHVPPSATPAVPSAVVLEPPGSGRLPGRPAISGHVGLQQQPQLQQPSQLPPQLQQPQQQPQSRLGNEQAFSSGSRAAGQPQQQPMQQPQQPPMQQPQQQPMQQGQQQPMQQRQQDARGQEQRPTQSRQRTTQQPTQQPTQPLQSLHKEQGRPQQAVFRRRRSSQGGGAAPPTKPPTYSAGTSGAMVAPAQATPPTQAAASSCNTAAIQDRSSGVRAAQTPSASEPAGPHPPAQLSFGSNLCSEGFRAPSPGMGQDPTILSSQAARHSQNAPPVAACQFRPPLPSSEVYRRRWSDGAIGQPAPPASAPPAASASLASLRVAAGRVLDVHGQLQLHDTNNCTVHMGATHRPSLSASGYSGLSAAGGAGDETPSAKSCVPRSCVVQSPFLAASNQVPRRNGSAPVEAMPAAGLNPSLYDSGGGARPPFCGATGKAVTARLPTLSATAAAALSQGAASGCSYSCCGAVEYGIPSSEYSTAAAPECVRGGNNGGGRPGAGSLAAGQGGVFLGMPCGPVGPIAPHPPATSLLLPGPGMAVAYWASTVSLRGSASVAPGSSAPLAAAAGAGLTGLPSFGARLCSCPHCQPAILPTKLPIQQQQQQIAVEQRRPHSL